MGVKNELDQLFKSGSIELVSTHEHLSIPIIERIYKKMALKLKFGSIQVEKGVIINGHHRYVASLLTKYQLEQVPGIKSQAKNTFEWTAVKLLDEDWDTPAKVKLLNEEDAKYNGMSLEELLEKIK
jgi:hypothetical protein